MAEYPTPSPDQLEEIAPGEYYAEVYRLPRGGAWPWLVFIRRQGHTFHVANDIAATRWGAMRKAKRLLAKFSAEGEPALGRVEIVRAPVTPKAGE